MNAFTKFRHATTGFPAKWRLRNERKNSILMTRYYPDLGRATDWLKIFFSQSEVLPGYVCRDTSYAVASQTSFRGEISGDVATCRLFS